MKRCVRQITLLNSNRFGLTLLGFNFKWLKSKSNKVLGRDDIVELPRSIEL